MIVIGKNKVIVIKQLNVANKQTIAVIE